MGLSSSLPIWDYSPVFSFTFPSAEGLAEKKKRALISNLPKKSWSVISLSLFPWTGSLGEVVCIKFYDRGAAGLIAQGTVGALSCPHKPKARCRNKTRAYQEETPKQGNGPSPWPLLSCWWPACLPAQGGSAHTLLELHQTPHPHGGRFQRPAERCQDRGMVVTRPGLGGAGCSQPVGFGRAS